MSKNDNKKLWLDVLYGPVTNVDGKDERVGGLLEISASKLGPAYRGEISLMLTLLIDAARSRDNDFLYNGPANTICELTHIDYEQVKLLIEKTWEKEDGLSK